jgi:hypothetical protein
MKEIWSGFLRAIGAGVLTLATCLLLGLMPPLRRAVKSLFGIDVQPGKTSLTIFLFVSSIVLLGLLIWSRVSYSRFRMRVYEKKVTEDELRPEMMKAVTRRVMEDQEKWHPKQSFVDRMLQWLMKH